MKSKFAKISRLAYETDSKKQRELARNLGYKIDNEFSNQYHTVLIDEKNKDVIISFRGTNPTDLRDIKTDINIFKNSKEKDERFNEAVEIFDKVKNEYSDYKFSSTGHSLGGGLSIYLNEKRGIDSYVFNPGSSPLIREKKVNNNVVIYRNSDDIISSGYNTKENKDNIIEIKNERNYLEYLNSFLNEGSFGIAKTLTKEQLRAHELFQFEDEQNPES